MANEFTNEDREMLIRVDERQHQFSKTMDNHLQHHFKYTLLAWSITLGALVTLVIALIKVL